MSPSFCIIKNILTLKGELLSLIKGKSFNLDKFSLMKHKIYYSCLSRDESFSELLRLCHELLLVFWPVYWGPLIPCCLKTIHLEIGDKNQGVFQIWNLVWHSPQKWTEATVEMFCAFFMCTCVYIGSVSWRILKWIVNLSSPPPWRTKK